MPVTPAGTSAFTEWACRPVVDDPDAVGEPCSLTGDRLSGFDTCEKHAICWDVDEETDEGTCFGMCIGTEANATCLDPDASCRISGDGILNLCIPVCDPRLQACPDGEACYPLDVSFTCAPIGEPNGLGDACEFINDCEAGSYCGEGGAFCNDPGSPGCCLPFCDLSQPDCPDATRCLPPFEPGTEPPGLENVGLCTG